MAKVELKQPIVQEISGQLENATAAVLVDYRGLTVAQDTALRKELREAGITYKVYKNTMMNFAVQDTVFADLSKHLEGPTAIAITEGDSTAPARILAKFAKAAEHLQLKAGVVEGTYFDEKGIMEVADVPARDILLGRLFGSMKSPITNLARVLNQIAEAGGAAACAPAAEEAPAEEAPAAEAPAEEAAPAAEAPAEEAPAAEAPAEEAPAAEAAPAEEAPAAE